MIRDAKLTVHLFRQPWKSNLFSPSCKKKTPTMTAPSFSLPADRDSLIILTKTAEQCERYDEMLVCMKRVIRASPVLNIEEKNLLSVAYKNVIGARRAPFRTLASVEQKSERGNRQYDLLKEYKARLEAEIGEICADIFELLEKHLVPNATDDESKVFYLKMKADYHRYFVEVNNSAEQTRLALETYTQAMSYSGCLPVSSPIRLGLALNFSVFYYEIKKMPDVGYDLAKKTFEEALPELERLNDDEYRESATIMSLLRENLSTWSEALQAPKGADEGMAMEDC